MQEPAQYGLQALLNDKGFASIKAGDFSMGSRSGADDERPVHQVRISRAFEIGRFEVTQSQWETVMRNPHAQPEPADAKASDSQTISATPSHFKAAALPVESVSWGRHPEVSRAPERAQRRLSLPSSHRSGVGVRVQSRLTNGRGREWGLVQRQLRWRDQANRTERNPIAGDCTTHLGMLPNGFRTGTTRIIIRPARTSIRAVPRQDRTASSAADHG